jgi:hypothetical protein
VPFIPYGQKAPLRVVFWYEACKPQRYRYEPPATGETLKKGLCGQMARDATSEGVKNEQNQ